MKIPCVYILAAKPFGTLYVGVTSDLNARMAQHSQGLFDGFTKRFGIKSLVYNETHLDMTTAIHREKLLKRWNRAWKYRLIEQMNREWADLFDPAAGEIRFGPAKRCVWLRSRMSLATKTDPRLRGDDVRSVLQRHRQEPSACLTTR